MADIVPEKTLKFDLDYSKRESVPIRIPFAENVNDKNVLFAGSIASAGVLSSYRAVTFLFRDKGYEGNIFCKEAAAKFLKPIKGEGFAKTVRMTEIEKRKSGNYIVHAFAEVSDDKGVVCSEVTSDFVLVPPAKS